MPVRYVIDKELRLVLTVGEGHITFNEVKAKQDQMLSDPDFNAGFNHLVDLTTATDLDMSVDEAKELARRPIFSTTSRRAFVAKNPNIFRTGRVMEVQYEQNVQVEVPVEVFSDRDSALQWLGVTEDSGLF